MTVNENIGNKIKQLRKEKGLTQIEFGKHFGLSQNAVTNIETGKRELLCEELLNIADFFGVPTDYILKEKGVKYVSPELTMISKYTGLSEQAIYTLSLKKPLNDSITSLIEFIIDKAGYSLNCELEQLRDNTTILYDLYRENIEKAKDRKPYDATGMSAEEAVKFALEKFDEFTYEREKAQDIETVSNGMKYSVIKFFMDLIEVFSVSNVEGLSVQRFNEFKNEFYEIRNA